MKTCFKIACMMMVVGLAAAGCKKEDAGGDGTPSGHKAGVVYQTMCPIKDLPIEKSRFVDYEGKRIYFCCPGCDLKFLEDPEKYIKEMEDAGITLEKSPEPEGGKN